MSWGADLVMSRARSLAVDQGETGSRMVLGHDRDPVKEKRDDYEHNRYGYDHDIGTRRPDNRRACRLRSSHSSLWSGPKRK